MIKAIAEARIASVLASAISNLNADHMQQSRLQQRGAELNSQVLDRLRAFRLQQKSVAPPTDRPSDSSRGTSDCLSVCHGSTEH